jgi:hypothetical protein
LSGELNRVKDRHFGDVTASGSPGYHRFRVAVGYRRGFNDKGNVSPVYKFSVEIKIFVAIIARILGTAPPWQLRARNCEDELHEVTEVGIELH